MKKEIYNLVLGILFTSTVISAVPVTNEESILASNSSRPPGTCLWEGKEYNAGESAPSPGPCEQCICEPPEVQCNMIKCKTSSGCKVIQRTNHCCPYYKCDCEHKGRTYNNGERLEMPEDPCQVCYCKGGEIMCTSVTCYERTDCQPRFTPGQCCPKYDHCPFQAPPNATKSVNASVYGSKREIQPWLMTKSTTVKPPEVTRETTEAIKNETREQVFPQTLKIHEILPTTPSYDQGKVRKSSVNLHTLPTSGYTTPSVTSNEAIKEITPEDSISTVHTTIVTPTETSEGHTPTQTFETDSSANIDENYSKSPTSNPNLAESKTENMYTEGDSSQKNDGSWATIKMRSMSGTQDLDKLVEGKVLTDVPVMEDQEFSSTAFPDIDSVTVKDPPYVLKGGLYEPFNETNTNSSTYVNPSEAPDIEGNSVQLEPENPTETPKSPDATAQIQTDDISQSYEPKSEDDLADELANPTNELPRSSDMIKDVDGEDGINLYIFGQDVATNETVLYTVLTPADLKTLAQILINKKLQKSENSHHINAEVKVGWLPKSDASTSAFMLETAKLNLDSFNCDKAVEERHENIGKPEKLSYLTRSSMNYGETQTEPSLEVKENGGMEEVRVAADALPSLSPLIVYEVVQETSVPITELPNAEIMLTDGPSSEPTSSLPTEVDLEDETKQVEPVDLNDLESSDKSTLPTTSDVTNGQNYEEATAQAESASPRKIPDVEPFLKQLPTSLDQRDVSILRDLLERHFTQP